MRRRGRRAGRRGAAAPPSQQSDTDLLLFSGPRHGRRSPACFFRITAAPVRSAVGTEPADNDDEHKEDEGAGGGASVDPRTDGGALRSAAAEEPLLFGELRAQTRTVSSC